MIYDTADCMQLSLVGLTQECGQGVDGLFHIPAEMSKYVSRQLKLYVVLLKRICIQFQWNDSNSVLKVHLLKSVFNDQPVSASAIKVCLPSSKLFIL